MLNQSSTKVGLDYEVSELRAILDKIKKQKKIKIISIALIPFIIGLLIFKKTNKNLKSLVTEKNRIMVKIESTSQKSLDFFENEVLQIMKEDTYLIYSVKSNILFKFNKLSKDLSFLIQNKEVFSQEFNSLIDDSHKQILKLTKDVINFNSNFISNRIEKYDYLFRKIPFSLDENQKRAVVTDDKHNLVVSAAGSGKTEVLITRIAYLIERKPDTIEPQRILALAFTKKAAQEIAERLKKRFGFDVKIKTFHALGNEILREVSKICKKSMPRLKFSDYERQYMRFIQSLFNKTFEKKTFQNEIINYMKLYGDDKKEHELDKEDQDLEKEAKRIMDFESKERLYNYMQNLEYMTLDGTKVKSKAEREIYNFFFMRKLNEKNILIKYEEPAEWMKYQNEFGYEIIPKPDFFFPDYGIYIEHWATDKNGKVPDWFEGKIQSQNTSEENTISPGFYQKTIGYSEGKKLKKNKFSEQNKYMLIETAHWEYKEKDFNSLLEKRFLKQLKKKFPKNEFNLTQIPYEELVNKVWKECREAIKALPRHISEFIVIAKTYDQNPNDIMERLLAEKWSPKQKAFANIALEIYKSYENELRSNNSIDYPDMINIAVDELEKKEIFDNAFDHILVDEYQDISMQRYKLIKALMDKNSKCKLFCVGDDWQSIYGFAGSDLDFFVEFHKFFDHPARTDLTVNYRSCKSIVDTGKAIIEKNMDAQLQKETISSDEFYPKKVIDKTKNKS